MHGGKSLRGLDHRNTKLGSYRGKDLPLNLAQRFKDAAADPERDSLQADIDLVTSRIYQIVDKFPTKESAEAWAVVEGLLLRLDGALLMGDAPDQAAQGFAEVKAVAEGLRQAVDLAGTERALWRELFDVQEHGRRLRDTERRRVEALETLVTERQGQLLVGTLLAAILDEVRDGRPALEIKRAVADRLRAALTATPRALPHARTVEPSQALGT